MSNYLLCATPGYGHVAPMIAIGRHLVTAGHRVRMLTGGRFAAAVQSAGMEHVPLPLEADYDDRDMEATFPELGNLTGVRALRFGIEHVFAGTLPHQYRGLREQIDREPVDAILVETGFTGIVPLLLERDRPRPPVLICGVVPITVSSRDTAPFGLGLPPSTTTFGRIRNVTLNLLVSRGIFGRTQRIVQGCLRDLGVKPLPRFFLDFPDMADRMLQLTSEGFEYPRSDLRAKVSFVGAILPAVGTFEPPTWWADLDTERPVVLVTQGTLANSDLDRLMVPTIRALADQDVLVVATTGDEESAAALRANAPANLRVAAFLPYDRLLPKVDVMVTNGGYGGVQFALAHGVPMVVAGDTEEKPEIAARVAWSGAGISLRTGSPKDHAISGAVRRILSEPGFRDGAQRLRDELAASTPLESITQALAEATISANRASISGAADSRQTSAL